MRASAEASDVERRTIDPRLDYIDKVEAVGLYYHHAPTGEPYWYEKAYYRFTNSDIDALDGAANECHRLCLDACRHIVEQNRFSELGIAPVVADVIRWAWRHGTPDLYGRFDLAYDGAGPPKMLEYNADTPTSLLEAAVVQWYWLEERFPDLDQFNSIWESLIDRWRELKSTLAGDVVYFAHLPNTEDLMTVTVLRDTATQAGLNTAAIVMEDIGWRARHRTFVDLDNRTIRNIFKLYPWEWIVKEQFGTNALETYAEMRWMEPIWRMLLSNKGILPILWELNPGHPNLLEAYVDGPRDLHEYVRKPMLSREGANVAVVSQYGTTESGGIYGDSPVVYQQLANVPNFGGNHPVIGAWVIGGRCRGVGIRESDGPITDNLSRFVPHVIV